MASRGMGRILRDEFLAGTTRCFSEGRRGRTGASMTLILPDPMTLVKQRAWAACRVLWRSDGCRLGPVQDGPSPSPPGQRMAQLRQNSARNHGRSPGVRSRSEQEGIVLGALQRRRNLRAQRLVQHMSQLESEPRIAEPLRHLRAPVERRPDELAAPLDPGDIEQAQVLMVIDLVGKPQKEDLAVLRRCRRVRKGANRLRVHGRRVYPSTSASTSGPTAATTRA